MRIIDMFGLLLKASHPSSKRVRPTPRVQSANLISSEDDEARQERERIEELYQQPV